jgi:hypothetical protein
MAECKMGTKNQEPRTKKEKWKGGRENSDKGRVTREEQKLKTKN